MIGCHEMFLIYVKNTVAETLKPNGYVKNSSDRCRISKGAPGKIVWADPFNTVTVNHLNSGRRIFVECRFIAYSWGCNGSVFSF